MTCSEALQRDDAGFLLEGGGAAPTLVAYAGNSKRDRKIVRIVPPVTAPELQEPYIAVNLTPGAEKRWSYTYALRQK